MLRAQVFRFLGGEEKAQGLGLSVSGLFFFVASFPPALFDRSECLAGGGRVLPDKPKQHTALHYNNSPPEAALDSSQKHRAIPLAEGRSDNRKTQSIPYYSMAAADC